MPEITYDDVNLCSDSPLTLIGTGCAGASRSEWIVIDRPAGSTVTFSAPNSPITDVTVSADGPYTFELRCYFDEGDIEAPDAADLSLGCPRGVIGGQNAFVVLNGCNGTVEYTVTGAAATGSSGTEEGVTVTTSATTSGPVDVEAVCRSVDNAGNVTEETVTCSFEVLPQKTELLCVTGAPTAIEFITCGQRCETEQVTVVFDCGGTVCETAELGIVFRNCPPCIDPEQCEPLEALTLTGQAAQFQECNSDFILGDGDPCCETVCCEPDRPLFFWNSLFSCPGWTAEAPAIEGSSIYNASTCSPGQPWCFEGPTATIIFSGPAQFVSSLVIWGHNITDGEVSTSPLMTSSGEPTTIGVTGDAACIEGYTTPVVIGFTDVPDEGITELAVTITSNTPGPICIDQIFVGNKFFLPEDKLPLSFQNPHNGSDMELEFKESSCGILSRSLKRTPVEMSIELECLSDEWVKDQWRPFLRYAQRHGLLMQWSRNRCPQDVFNGWIEGPYGPSRYDEEGTQSVTLTARGYVTQPQAKTFV